MLSDPPQPPGFVCTQCGDCCRKLSGMERAVLLTPADIARIDAFIENHPTLAGTTYADPDPLAEAPPNLRRIKPRDNGDCPFLDAAGLCAVQPVKPHQCRHMPYRFFFGESEWPYACGAGVAVPDHWTSDRYDAIFVDELAAGES